MHYPKWLGPVMIIILLVTSTLVMATSARAFAQILPNLPPVALDQILSVNEDTPLGITLTATDVDGDELSYSVVIQPSHGALNGTAPDLVYTPEGNYSGSDNFTFKASDGTDESNTATVSITINGINDMPTADGQSVSTDQNMPVPITLSGSDVEDNSPLTYAVTLDPIHGVLSDAAPNLTYTPEGNYTGADEFKFTVTDSEDSESNEATVSITINSVNNGPVANNQTVSTDEDTPLPITLIATDPDLDELGYSVVDNPGHGELSGAFPDVIYTPDIDYVGPDSFTFRASDGISESNTATVAIMVNAVGAGPTVDAGPDQTVPEDVIVTLDGTASDDAVTLFWTQISGPSVALINPRTEDPTFAAPSSSTNSVMEFQLNATDADGNEASDTVTITESSGNQPPVANAGSDQNVNERSTVTLNGDASSDSDGSISSYSWAQIPGPTVTLSDASKASPTFEAPSVDTDTTLVFSLTVTDNGDAVDSDLVSITVENVPRRSGGGGGGGGGSSGGSGGGGGSSGSSGVITDSTAPTISVSPPAGTYSASQLITLISNEANTTIHYTTNGIDPTASSPQYTSPITILADTTLKFVGTDSAGNKGAVVSAAYDINMIHMNDIETNGTGWGIYSTRPVLSEYVNSSSVLVGKYIDSITIDLKKSARATGMAEIGIINPDLTMKKVFGALDISTLSDTRYLPNKFNLTSEYYLIQAGDRIGVKYTGGTSNSSHISIMRDTSIVDPFDGNNTYLSYYTTSWTNQTTYDLVMTLEYSGKSPVVLPASYFLANPLAKIMVLGTSFFNAQGTSVLNGAVGEQIQLSSTLHNRQQTSQNCTYLVQILDETGVATAISMQPGVVEPGQSITIDRSWLPLKAGTYTIKVFVWDETIESLEPLSTVTERTILVE